MFRYSALMFILLCTSVKAESWYYCDSAKAYYPYVTGCPEPWREVKPSSTPAASSVDTTIQSGEASSGVVASTASSSVDTAMVAFNKGEYDKALLQAAPSAKQGNVIDQNILGRMYLEGKGIKQNYEQAQYWFLKAANQGYANSQHNLGLMYVDGRGVNQNYAQGIEWYRKAAEQGLDLSQIALGSIYQNGQGVTQSYAIALDWYYKAAKQGNSNAKNYIRAVSAKLAANIQIIKDAARGYHQISIADYQLDANSMRMGEKLIIRGYYEVSGSIQTLSRLPSFEILNQYNIYLLTDNAPRNVRKKLIDLQQPIQCGSSRPCQLTFLGRIGKCTYSVLGTKVNDTICINVDDVREVETLGSESPKSSLAP